MALGIHVASFLKLGDVQLIEGTTDMVREQNVEYDARTNMTLGTSSGIEIQIAQDVLTQPAIKELKIISNDIELLWCTNMSKGGDFVKFNGVETFFQKTRIDDFQPEIEHIDEILNSKCTASPIELKQMFRVSELSKKCYEYGIQNEV